MFTTVITNLKYKAAIFISVWLCIIMSNMRLQFRWNCISCDHAEWWYCIFDILGVLCIYRFFSLRIIKNHLKIIQRLFTMLFILSILEHGTTRSQNGKYQIRLPLKGMEGLSRTFWCVKLSWALWISVLDSSLEGYSFTFLPRKLRSREFRRVYLTNAPNSNSQCFLQSLSDAVKWELLYKRLWLESVNLLCCLISTTRPDAWHNCFKVLM